LRKEDTEGFLISAPCKGAVCGKALGIFFGKKTNMERRIIDKRKKEKFLMDDAYLNGQARLCGWQGTIVYNSLCRHADINQESFPSIKLMAEQHRVGSPTIIKGIKNLEKRKIIQVKKTRTKDGKWLNNTYVLLDKSEWDYSQVLVEDTASRVTVGYMDHVTVDTPPCNRGEASHVTVGYTKETHREGNTYKETHLFSKTDVLQGKEISMFIGFFVEVNPSFGLLFKNTTERASCGRLLKMHSLDEWAVIVKEILPQVNADRFSKGKSIKPTELERNLGHIKAWIDQQKQSKPKVIRV